MNRNDPREVQLEPRLAAELRALGERGMAPRRDLWPEVAAELPDPGVGRRGRWTRLAAAAALVAGIAGVSAWWAGERAAVDPEPLVAARTAADLPASSSDALRATFVRYLDDRRALLAEVARELDGVPPDLRRDIVRNIEVIEGAMLELEASLARLPGTEAEEVLLADLYERELRFLRELSARLQGSAVGVGREASR